LIDPYDRAKVTVFLEKLDRSKTYRSENEIERKKNRIPASRLQSWASRRKAIVKKVRAFPKLIEQEKQFETQAPSVFVFCDSNTGMPQFRSESARDIDCTVERVAGQLAMQCLVRGQDPKNFQVLVPAEGSLISRLIARAEELLEEGRSVACPTSLSARQREVLHAVLCNRANKEIASKLNITVRTVKFHISTLLSKFGVESRADLAQRASGFVRGVASDEESPMDFGMAGRRPRLQAVRSKTPVAITSKPRLSLENRAMMA
jgi:DNA-binding CsgD family transcriptional regulator